MSSQAKTRRADLIANAAQHAANPPSTPAPRRASAAAALVEHLPAQAPKTSPFDAAKPKGHVDQAVVDSWLTAMRGSGEAAVALFIACIGRTVAPAQFIGFTDGSARKTASIFNAAHKHAKLFTAARTRKVITQAMGDKGDVRLAIYTALSKENAYGREAAASGKTGATLHAVASARAAQAVADVKAKDADRQAARTTQQRETRLPAMPKAGTLDAYVPVAAQALITLRKGFSQLSLSAPVMKHGQDYLAALDAASEALQAINDR